MCAAFSVRNTNVKNAYTDNVPETSDPLVALEVSFHDWGGRAFSGPSICGSGLIGWVVSCVVVAPSPPLQKTGTTAGAPVPLFPRPRGLLSFTIGLSEHTEGWKACAPR